MSAFNGTEAAQYAALNNCPPNSYAVTAGTLKFAIACVPKVATSADEVACASYENMVITADDTCESVLALTTNENPDSDCYLACDLAPVSSNPLAARGLPMEDYVTGAASTVHPSSLAFTFAALFFVALMFFKRSH